MSTEQYGGLAVNVVERGGKKVGWEKEESLYKTFENMPIQKTATVKVTKCKNTQNST